MSIHHSSDQEEFVVLVDNQDNDIGTMEKMEAHQRGVLHRAFSVFLLNSENQIMLQQRAWSKYHSPGLWTNTCCSHPRQYETVIDAAQRRLQEEMGILHNELRQVFDFVYKADVGQGLIEHELDHVLIGHYDGVPRLNPDEVAEWKWIEIPTLVHDMKAHPEMYTKWFQIIFDQFYDRLSKEISQTS